MRGNSAQQKTGLLKWNFSFSVYIFNVFLFVLLPLCHIIEVRLTTRAVKMHDLLCSFEAGCCGSRDVVKLDERKLDESQGKELLLKFYKSCSCQCMSHFKGCFCKAALVCSFLPFRLAKGSVQCGKECSSKTEHN